MADIVVTISGDPAAAQRALRAVGQEAQGLGAVVQKLQANWLAVGAAIAATEGARRFISSAIGAASDLEESVSKVNVVFGESAASIRDWADDASTALGLSEQAALESAGTFGNLFTAMGLARGEASGLSQDVVQLGVDFASFNNIGTAEALEKLRAGLVGEAEPLRALGVNINAATVEAKALELGLAATTGAIDDSAKILARWALITEQSTNAAGDFERTSDGLANQQKILNAQLKDLQTNFGSLLIEPMTAATIKANELLTTLEDIGDLGAIQVAIDIVTTGLDRDLGGGITLGGLIASGFFAALPGGSLFKSAMGLGGGDGGPGAADLGPFSGDPGLTGLPAAAPWGVGPAPFDDEGFTRVTSFPLAAMIAAEQERAEAARKAAQAVGGLSAVERERIRIVEDQTTQVIEAYLRGGDEAVGAVRSQIDEANAAWGELAAGLEERFGIEADLYRGNWEQILEEEAQFAKELVELERERWEQTVAAATSGFERILRAHASAGLPFTGRVEDYLFDLNRGPLTPTEALLMGQSGTPTVNVTVEAHLPSGVMAEMYIEGREGAQARGLE